MRSSSIFETSQSFLEMSQTFETVGPKFETSQSFLEMSQTFETVVNHSQVVEWMAEAEATFTSDRVGDCGVC